MSNTREHVFKMREECLKKTCQAGFLQRAVICLEVAYRIGGGSNSVLEEAFQGNMTRQGMERYRLVRHIE